MKILVFGAGVIGCIYAAKLFAQGHEVKLLTRNKRHEDLERNGIKLKERLTGAITTHRVPIVHELKPTDFYDLIMVTVRFDQLENVMPLLQANTASAEILLMLNYPGNLENIKNQLPGKQLIIGFPGVGGSKEGNQIDYIQIKQQKTTLGEIDGTKSDVVVNLKSLFESAGFKTEVSFYIRDWLKTHAVFISCISAAIFAKGSSVELASDKGSVQAMVAAIRQGFRALQSLGISIEPGNLKTIFLKMPNWFSVWYWRRAMKSDLGRLAIEPHAKAATGEMRIVASEILTFVKTSSVPIPGMQRLLTDFIKRNQLGKG